MEPAAAFTDDYRTQFRILLDGYVAHAQRLRTLHEHYLELQHDTELSTEQRRAAFLRILHAELAVLVEAQGIKQTMDALREEHLSHLRFGS